jgi:hypothetical protein
MEVIKVGVYSFNAEYLREKTSKEAKEELSHIPPAVVLEAWKLANPKQRTTKTKKDEN